VTHLDIMKTCYENERKRMLALALERASNLEESARLLRVAAETSNLDQIARHTKFFDMELSTRVLALRDNLEMIAGLDAQTQDAIADGDDRCYCESLAQQRKPGPCKVCKRMSLAASLKAKANGACHQDVNTNSALCAIHGTVPDWSSELPNYKGPTGWICSEGGLFKQDFTTKVKP
jgi:hypothetical protein